MNIELITAFIRLIEILIWPAILLLILGYLRLPLKRFMEEVGEFNFIAGPTGIEASAKRRQVEAAASLGAAEALRAARENEEFDEATVTAIADTVTRATSRRSMRQRGHRTILWVDDHPANNRYERKALEALGIQIDESLSTEDAMSKLHRRAYDVVITDMGRPPDARAGYTLLHQMQDENIKAPLIIYARGNLPEHRREAHSRGAFGNTNNPQELFQLVTRAIEQSRG